MNIKDEFGWAIPLTKAEIDDIWDRAILTVDTNVLLDLYRYHPKTRDSILNSFRMFEGRLWLSHQVVKEFFKNRTTVISSARKYFDEGEKIIKDLPISINKHIDELIKSNRTISKDLINKIKDKILLSISDLLKNENDKSEKVSYTNDEIINKIIQYFENNIGNKFGDDEYKEILEKAKDRFSKKIPPGYEDEKKEEEDKYGDFFLWEQILKQGELVKLPIILVTSERKEDWWEKKSGETVGLRPELKREAWERLQQHILVYQTESFLSKVAEKESEKNIVKEINDAIKEVKQLNFEKEEIIGLHKFKKSQIVNKVEQSIEFSTEYTNVGYISCHIGHPTKYFTVSGQLEPRLKDIPIVKVELVDSPKEYFAEPYASTGTKYDFNIHMKSKDIIFDVGNYTFKYYAYLETKELGNYYYEELTVPCPNCGGNYLLDINQCIECGYESIRECQLCHNEINGYELDSAPYCGHCSYKIYKDD